MASVTGKALDWKLLGRVMHYVKPYNGKFIIATFLTIFLAAIALVQPILIQKTLDKIFWATTITAWYLWLG
jgi:ATP-binding cassette subfamily B multidrug efflux pump